MGICERKEMSNMSNEISIDEKRKTLRNMKDELIAADIHDSEFDDILNNFKYQGKDIDDLSDSEIYEIYAEVEKQKL